MIGYRTLLVAMRVLSEAEVEQFSVQIKEASVDLKNKANLMESISRQIESNLTLIGATVVEDRLQDDVAETIEALDQADIKVWILTGDKMETAVSIGYSCRILTVDHTVQRCRTLVELE